MLCSVSYGADNNMEDPPAPSVAEQTKEIINVVSRYGSSIGCLEAGPEAKDIAALTPFKSMMQRDDAKFAVLWVGDIGCAGGSGTISYNLAIVKVGAGNNFYVDPWQSEPAITTEIPRAIERIVGATNDTLILDTLDYGENDANCCPSIRERITIKSDKEGNWKLINKKRLPNK